MPTFGYWDTFEKRLRWALTQSPKTRIALAEEIGTDGPRFSDWTSGRQAPSLKYLLQMPDALRVDGHWLLTGQGDPEPKESAGWKLSAIKRVLDANSLDDDLRRILEALDDPTGGGGSSD